MKRALAIVTIIVLVVSFACTVSANGRIFDMEKAYNYSSHDYNKVINDIVDKYKDLLTLERIGESANGRPIVAIRLSTTKDDADYVNKLHIIIEAGTHAREILNTAVVVRMIEDYCMDYHDNNTLKDVNIKEELRDSVIHFIPLTNPDGHDLVKFGPLASINKDIKVLIPKYDHKTLKSNANGVDLNRNYPDIYFDGTKVVDVWGKLPGDYKVTSVASEMYQGTKAGSEKEIQAVSSYILRYDFRAGLSYHSMGSVIYYNRGQLDSSFNNMAREFANAVSKAIGYRIPNPEDDTSLPMSGYLSHFFNGTTLKPLITIETTNYKQPSSAIYFKTEYNSFKLYKPPIEVLRIARTKGYYDYKIYKDGKYVRDMYDKAYAKAMADYIGGKLITYKGKPFMNELDAIIAQNYTNLNKNAWYYNDAVSVLTHEPKILDIEEGMFKPSEIFTVEQSIKSMIALAGYKIMPNYMHQAIDLGITNDSGFEDTKRPITREEMVEVLYRTLEKIDVSTIENINNTAAKDINDYEDINEMYKDSVISAYNIGIVNGDKYGNFNPNQTVTRAEAAVFIGRALELMK